MMKRLPVLALALLGAMNFARAQSSGNTSAPGQPLPGPAPIQPESKEEIVDTDTSPYHQALLSYKTGKYDEARTAIDAAEKAKPGDLATEVLKSRILTEQHEYAEGEKLLRSLFAPAQLSELPQDANTLAVELALADLLLHKHSFDGAAKYYSLVLQAKPNDPDITLKLIYAETGASQLIVAGKYASQLKPNDPDHPSYYFAKAALARATDKEQEAEDAIQTARTIYGITITNRYLKTYLEVFAGPSKNPASNMTPPK